MAGAEGAPEAGEQGSIRTSSDIMRSTMTDDLRFAVLIGLVEVGQMEDKEIVNTILHLVSRNLRRGRGIHVRVCLSGGTGKVLHELWKEEELMEICGRTS